MLVTPLVRGTMIPYEVPVSLCTRIHLWGLPSGPSDVAARPPDVPDAQAAMAGHDQ
jgi:hypothetical protein